MADMLVHTFSNWHVQNDSARTSLERLAQPKIRIIHTVTIPPRLSSPQGYRVGANKDWRLFIEPPKSPLLSHKVCFKRSCLPVGRTHAPTKRNSFCPLSLSINACMPRCYQKLQIKKDKTTLCVYRLNRYTYGTPSYHGILSVSRNDVTQIWSLWKISCNQRFGIASYVIIHEACAVIMVIATYIYIYIYKFL